MRLLTFTLLLVAFDARAGSAEEGKAAFIQHGCYECHGFAGQGGVGKKLAPEPIAFEAFSAIVRNSNNAMPPYQKAILSDADLASIYAYLRSIPKAPDYKSIPLLNQ
jgi:mono/diheme cytochrome c family protein